MNIHAAPCMRSLGVKTARFSQVVAKCGRPVVHDQWVAPEKDSALKQAVKQNRLMTLRIHSVGAKKDYGETGLVKAPQRVLLLFPKSLRAFQGRRIVGINYDLLKELPQRPAKKTPPPKAHKEKPAEREPRSAASEHFLRLFRPEKEPADDAAESDPPPQETAEPAHKAEPKRGQSKQGPQAPKKAAPARKASAAAAPGDGRRLRAAIQKAMKQLQSGKAVQAYQTLETAVK